MRSVAFTIAFVTATGFGACGERKKSRIACSVRRPLRQSTQRRMPARPLADGAGNEPSAISPPESRPERLTARSASGFAVLKTMFENSWDAIVSTSTHLPGLPSASDFQPPSRRVLMRSPGL